MIGRGAAFVAVLTLSAPAALRSAPLPAVAPPESAEVPPDPAEIESLRREVARLAARLEDRKGEMAGVEEEARRLGLQVELLSRERRLAQAERRQAEAGIARLTAERREAERARDEARGRLAVRLARLYRLGSAGVARLVVAPGSGDRLAAARSLAVEARRDRRLVEELDERSATLARQAGELELLGATAAELAARLSAKEEELAEARRRQAIVATELRRVQARDQRRLGELEARAARLERVLELLEKSRSRPRLDGEDPRRFRGALARPVEGEVRSRFGRQKHPRFDAWVMNNGIEVAAPAGTRVVAAYPGRVVHARWLKGYGNLVIVDHGARFLSLYGRLAAVSVREGDDVRMNDPVGVVAAPTEDEPAGAYLEIRDAGKAVDPLPWFRPSGAGSR